MKGFHFPPTRTTNSIRLILGSQYSLYENYIKWARLLWGLKQVLGTNLIPLRTKFDTQTKRVPAYPVINQLWFPERHFSAKGISLRLGEVQMKLYERSLQALLSSAPRGFTARSHVLARLASLTQIGELARRLDLCLISHHLHWSISGVDYCVFLVWINCFLYPRHIHCKLTVFWGELFHAKSCLWRGCSVHVVT